MTDLEREDEHEVDLMAIAKRLGLPTWEEFQKTPEKWVGKPLELLDHVDNGPKDVRKLVNKIKYKIKGYIVEKPEQVENIILREGINPDHLSIESHLDPLPGGKTDILVEFVEKMPSRLFTL